jgi:hypothetical protein
LVNFSQSALFQIASDRLRTAQDSFFSSRQP